MLLFRVQRKRTKRKGTRAPRRVNNTAGPSDCPVFMPFRVLLEAVGILKTRGVYAPKGCLCSEGVLKQFKILIDIFFGARQGPMGKYAPFEGAT